VDRVISKIKKSGTAELWVVLSDFTGALRLDLREYFRSDDGTYKPTRKGISIDRTETAGLISALEALSEASQPGTVAIVARRPKAEVTAGVREYQGHIYTEVRQFVPDKAGGWRATGKGITFKAGIIPALVEAVEMAEALFGEDGAAPTNREPEAGTADGAEEALK
jgi:hypothetical protein